MAEGGRGGNPSPVAAALAPGTADSMSESASSQRRASFGRACWCGSLAIVDLGPKALASLRPQMAVEWDREKRGARVCTPEAEWGAEKRGGVLDSVGKEQAVRCTYTSLSLSVSLSCRVSADVVTRAPLPLGRYNLYYFLRRRFWCHCNYGYVLPFPLLHRIRLEASGDYPPNLSISLSGGKEINRDLPSSGERTGASPALNRGPAHAGREMWGEGLPAHPRGGGRAPHV